MNEPTHSMTIYNLHDLCHFFGVDEACELSRAVYKGTDCGASISVQIPSGKWFHNGDNWEAVREIKAFTIQTIVEGSDATVDSGEFVLPVKGSDVDAWIEEMEQRASVLWEDANNPTCECGHRAQDHSWISGESTDTWVIQVGDKCLTEDCDCKRFKELEGYDI